MSGGRPEQTRSAGQETRVGVARDYTVFHILGRYDKGSSEYSRDIRSE